MNDPEIFLLKCHWANGWPAIDISPYNYDSTTFKSYCTWLSDNFECKDFFIDEAAGAFGHYWAECKLQSHQVNIAMDNWTFGIGFEKEPSRDEVFNRLLTRENFMERVL